MKLVEIRSKRVLIEDRGVLAPGRVVYDQDSGLIVGVQADGWPGSWTSEGVPSAEAIKEKRDFGDAVIFPGLVDSHVHVNDPGRTEWEGYNTATRAAASGGVTTLADMPLNSIPSTVSMESLGVKVKTLGERELFCDVALLGGVVPGNLGEIEKMVVDGGCVGFKCFLLDSGVDEFKPVTGEEAGEAMKVLAPLNVPLMFHAELIEPIEDASKKIEGAPSNKYETFLQSRPGAAEEGALELVVRLCKETGCGGHIVHLSAASALPTLRAAHEAGVPLTAETCFHYLHFDAESIPDGSTLHKCCPPIREAMNRDQLWDALLAGQVCQVVSDHSPSTAELKILDKGDFMKAWGGISSLGLGLSITWTAAKVRGVVMTRLAEWLCAAPARLLGIEDFKGHLAPGYCADIVVWNPDEQWTVEASATHVKNKVTPYHGAGLQGKVQATILRGDYTFDSSKGGFVEARGKQVRRTAYPAKQ